MLNLGLSYAQQLELNHLLVSPHRLRIGMSVLDLDHNYIGSLSDAFLGGSVTIDVTSDITRTLSIDVADISRSIQLAPDDPDEGAAFPTRMLRCTYGVGRPDASRWYDIPVFTGPVIKADRDGAVLHLEAQGKEALGMGSLWKGKTYGPGWNKGSLVYLIMSQLSGETRFDLSRTAVKTTKKTVINRGASGPWVWAKAVAASLGMQAFYDGRGYLRMRPYSQKPVWLFDELCLVDDPQIGFLIDELVNAVEITGAKPKGAKNPITYKVVAPSSHPLSPYALRRGGIPKFYPHIEENTDLKTYADTKNYGDTLLRNGLIQSVQATLDSFVVPHLEENDLVGIRTGGIATDVRMKQATIPLICTDSMSVGYTKAVKPSKLSRRLRRS